MNEAGELPALDHLEALEEIITTGRRVPFSSGVVVNEDAALDALDGIRSSFPETVAAAARTIVERQRLHRDAVAGAESILAQADADAEAVVAAAREEAEQIRVAAQQDAASILETAREDAERLTATSAITARAEAEAAEMLAQAEIEAQELRTDAEDYAAGVMGALEEQLDRIRSTVQRGVEALPQPGSRRPRR